MSTYNNVVLLIDEHVSMRKVLGNVLSKANTVVTKKNTLEAFAWLQEGNVPNSIILGLGQESSTNDSFVSHLNCSGFFTDIPVIVLSERIDQSFKNSILKQGAVDFIPKPFKPEVICAKVNEFKEVESHVLSRNTGTSLKTEKVYAFIPKIRELMTGAMLYLFNQL